MRTRPLHMCRLKWLVSKESKQIIIPESTTPIYLYTVQLLWDYDDD